MIKAIQKDGTLIGKFGGIVTLEPINGAYLQKMHIKND